MNRRPPSGPQAEGLGVEFISELNKLSIEERNEITFDLHGVKPIVNEDPEIVAKSTDLLELELNGIPNEEKQAYLRARDRNPGYVMDKTFLLMFLRAQQFNTKAAAAQFVDFFQIKLELFGEEKLGRDIRMDDLNDGDVECLESGYAQVLNARDRAGRAIFLLMPTVGKFETIETKLRAAYMLTMYAIQDVDTQKNGVVSIVYNVGRGKSKDRDAAWKFSRMFAALPARQTGAHYCIDDDQTLAMFYIAMNALSKAARLRSRIHVGSHMEIIYTLMTFGIPKEALPVSLNGRQRLESHRDLVRRMRRVNGVDDNINRIIVPGTFDVILGRGKPLQKYSGNLNYHYIIEGYHDRYEAAAKGKKAELAMEIVKKIQSQGGNFLKEDDAGWVVIDDAAARSKVSHTFRNHRIAARTALKKAAVTVPSNSRQKCRFRENSVPEISTDIEHKKKKHRDDFGDEYEDELLFNWHNAFDT